MCNVFDTKVGTSFNSASPRITYSVRQKELEIIFKFNKGFFCIINVLYSVGGELLLVANLGKYFDVLLNPDIQLPKVELHCPVLNSILTDKHKNGFFFGHLPEGDSFIGKEFAIPHAYYLPQLLSAYVIHTVRQLADTVYDCFRELHDVPPFPGWKKQLNVLWN